MIRRSQRVHLLPAMQVEERRGIIPATSNPRVGDRIPPGARPVHCSNTPWAREATPHSWGVRPPTRGGVPPSGVGARTRQHRAARRRTRRGHRYGHDPCVAAPRRAVLDADGWGTRPLRRGPRPGSARGRSGRWRLPGRSSDAVTWSPSPGRRSGRQTAVVPRRRGRGGSPALRWWSRRRWPPCPRQCLSRPAGLLGTGGVPGAAAVKEPLGPGHELSDELQGALLGGDVQGGLQDAVLVGRRPRIEPGGSVWSAHGGSPPALERRCPTHRYGPVWLAGWPHEGRRERDHGVQQLLHQRHPRPARHNGVQVHLGRAAGPGSDAAQRHRLRSLQALQDRRVAVQLDEADDDVHAELPPLPLAFGEHGAGLADVGGVADVDPQGWLHLVGWPVARRVSTSRRISIGSGKIRVELRSAETSAMVDSTRNCIAAGCASRISAALPRVSAASNSPWAWMTLARRSRSASACRAMARRIASGSSTSLTSTRVTLTPQGLVTSSMICCRRALMSSRLISSSSRSTWTSTLRRVVWEICEVPTKWFSMAITERTGSATLK